MAARSSLAAFMTIPPLPPGTAPPLRESYISRHDILKLHPEVAKLRPPREALLKRPPPTPSCLYRISNGSGELVNVIVALSPTRSTVDVSRWTTTCPAAMNSTPEVL